MRKTSAKLQFVSDLCSNLAIIDLLIAKQRECNILQCTSVSESVPRVVL